MHAITNSNEPLVLKDCSLISVSAGRRAQNLREFREQLSQVSVEVLYHHFYGRLLRPSFDDPEYSNDFAVWTARSLGDKRLAEQLGVLDPSEFSDWEDLRAELLEVLDARLDASEHVPWAKPDNIFNFTYAQRVIFDTTLRLHSPEELARQIPNMSPGVIYFHVIDARARPPFGMDDFRNWLSTFGSATSELTADLANVDPFFRSLVDLRDALTDTMLRHFPELGL